MGKSYKEAVKGIWAGTAKLIVDERVKFWTRSKSGPGFQIEGFRDTEAAGQFPGIIVKAKLGDDWVCPRKLHNRKVFYKFYWSEDISGRKRPYLYMAARHGDFIFKGQRRIVISAEAGVFMNLDRQTKNSLARVKGEEGDFTGRTRADFLAAQFFPEEGY